MNLIDIVIPLLILLIFVIGVYYSAYQVWWKFSETQRKIIQGNESRGALGSLANIWINHWTYKWMVRIVTLFMVFLGSIGFVGVLYQFLKALFS